MCVPKLRTVKRYFKHWILFPGLILAFEGLFVVKSACGTIFSLIFQKKSPYIIRTPEDRFKGLESVGYTFKPNYVELPVGAGKRLPRIHYVDEGPRDAKEVILCLHGEPSWCFLYRYMIPVFVKASYRVIAPDFIGFGKSDKFTSPESYTHELHTMSLRLLLDYLNIRGLTLVCQDWGGLTGLSVVKDAPQYFSRLVMMNTGLPAGSEFSINTIDRVTPFLMWRSFAQLLGASLPVYHIFKSSLLKPHPAVLDGYNAPFPSPLYKGGAAKWPLLVPITSHSPVAADMQATRDFLSSKWKNPALIMFSDRDPITKGQEKTFKKLLPQALSKTVVGAGHFLQDDKGEEIASHIVSFINKKS